MLLSKFVNFLINTKPLYAVMKVLAKRALKSSAEERGVSWDGHAKRLMSDAELKQIKDEMENKSMVYPSYYLQPFHAYDEGNLNWLAACEVEPATYAMAIRTFKSETDLTPMEAQAKLRKNITSAIKDYFATHSLQSPTNIVDVGCSTGISTRWLVNEFPGAKVTATDLSPHFLAVAELEERRHEREGGTRRVHYMHDKAENSVLETSSVDLMSFQFVMHECPGDAITNLVKESARVVRPGGVLCIVDNNPQSKTIQNLPPALFTLMKSTEPWSDEYYAYDIEQCLRDLGFTEVVTVCTDHRHRAILGIRAQ
ncbi:S-adenosyl-L-methionine-dependent methyltransferase [Dunaliella salina]|uniref:S-adenosyl-L-methionine-dependent methyltransferase n=1 Tax=Dunaliella salina TaxID=3046 RepID=A0ABQ7FU10_DUNSA|nr:S-adenosyl-L-methionine-dependent methyltransferase [Dunaliella salina]|eukprot:KAF5825902.1 S-adenosyl-L-methionine-dependent methyltransferase [Dunaliella salina]